MCQDEFADYCKDETTPILAITNPDFLSVNGTYNKVYKFTLQITWVKTVGGKLYSDMQEVISEVKWINASVPLFDLTGPSGGVKMTAANNQFFVQITNEDFSVPDLSIYRVEWSVVPNLTAPNLTLTKNNTLLTVFKGGFQPLTSYVITVKLSLLNQPLAVRSKTINFTTNLPPSGGTVSVDPSIGYVKDTLFTVKLDGWDSSSKPIRYQLFSTSDSGGEKRDLTLT